MSSIIAADGLFFSDADAAIKAWLIGPHGNTPLSTLSAALVARNPTIRPGEFATAEVALQESKSNHPLIYIFTGIFDWSDYEAKSLIMSCTTTISIFTDHMTPGTAGAEAMQVAALVSAILKNTGRGGATGFAWADTFSNYYEGDVMEITNTYPTPIQDTARVAMSLSMTWQHYEVI